VCCERNFTPPADVRWDLHIQCLTDRRRPVRLSNAPWPEFAVGTMSGQYDTDPHEGCRNSAVVLMKTIPPKFAERSVAPP
jgi:hypothetical protein